MSRKWDSRTSFWHPRRAIDNNRDDDNDDDVNSSSSNNNDNDNDIRIHASLVITLWCDNHRILLEGHVWNHGMMCKVS